MRRIISLLLILLFVFPAFSQNADSITNDNGRVEKLIRELQKNLEAYPVIINKDTLFTIVESPGFASKKKYAAFVESRIKKILEQDIYHKNLLNVVDSSGYMIVKYDDLSVVEFSDITTNLLGISKKEAADYSINSIANLLDKSQGKILLLKIFYLIIYLAAFYMAFLLMRYIYRKLVLWFRENDSLIDKASKLFRLRRVDEEDKEKAIKTLLPVLKYIYWVLIALLTYIMVPMVLSVFHFTKDISQKMLNYILGPVYDFGNALVAFIPNLIKIIVIYLIFRLFLKIISYLFNELKTGRIKINGFYQDWAQPTGNLVKLLLYAFLLTIIFPLLPGSDSEIFKGMSVFLGLLISLGSTSVIANVLSGIIMTYMRPFKIGDRIEADDVLGIVVQKNLLITRIRTPKNVIVTVPNSKILSGHSKNFTTAAEKSNLIVYGSITIGYDVDWRIVHELLIGAANKTNGIISQSGKEPFVLQKSLDDFYVAYEINAFIAQADKFIGIQSELFKNILNEFNEAGVEIMSPHYRANRSGEDITIPPKIVEHVKADEKEAGAMDINEKINARMEASEKQKKEDEKKNKDKEKDKKDADKNK